MDTKSFYKHCDIFQRKTKPSHHDETPLAPQITLQEFEKWAVDFIGPISLLGKRTGVLYIITTTDYLTRWAEAVPVKDCTTMTATKFLFKKFITQFCFPNIILSDQGMHFVNKVIVELTAEF